MGCFAREEWDIEENKTRGVILAEGDVLNTSFPYVAHQKSFFLKLLLVSGFVGFTGFP